MCWYLLSLGSRKSLHKRSRRMQGEWKLYYSSKVDQWASAGSVLYPTPAAGFITASAPKPSVTEPLVDSWFRKDTDCVRYVCLLPIAFMWIADPVRYPYPKYQNLCKSSDMLNQLAKCVGQYYPSDIAASYSTFSQGCNEADVAMVVAFA